MKKVNALVLGLVVLLAFGCGGDEPEPDKTSAPQQQNYSSCLYTHYSGNGVAEYFYNAKGQVVRTAGGSGTSNTVEYDSAGLMTRINNYSGPAMYSYTAFSYNTDSLIEKETMFLRYNVADPFHEAGFSVYTYDAQKRMSSRSFYEISKPTIAYSRTDYFYLPTGLRTEVYGTNQLTNVLELQAVGEVTAFDNQKTPGLGLQFFDWRNTSSHNPLQGTFEQYQNGTLFKTEAYTISYTYNSAGYPTQSIRTVAGQNPVITNYAYNCQ